jgi:hypothetical protein
VLRGIRRELVDGRGDPVQGVDGDRDVDEAGRVSVSVAVEQSPEGIDGLAHLGWGWVGIRHDVHLLLSGRLPFSSTRFLGHAAPVD